MTNKKKKNGFVAVLDSGVGGLSVLPGLTAELPGEDFVYFGDAANAPYGERTADEVREIVSKSVGRMIDEGAKAVVLACNTATSAAAAYLREKYRDVPIIGMEPALKPAAEAKEHPRVLVMATPLTIREDKLRELTERLRDEAEFDLIPCHGLVELVEAGTVEGNEVRELIERILAPHLPGADSIVLGCTHYAHVRETIRSVAGEDVAIFDGAAGTARETKRRLGAAGLLKRGGNGSVTLTDSSGDPGYKEICEFLLSRLK
ncbi:MAG: glutamate racemase [Clostridia bacterium]|nr:glutamate racemase [Clostridia bacterium]